MNPYIHPENQKRLWNTIHSSPNVANLPPDFKNAWFKNIVKMFYEQTPHIPDKQALLQINKQTIQYMMGDIKRMQSAAQSVARPNATQSAAISAAQSVQPELRQHSYGVETEFSRFQNDSKKNNEWYQQAFAERQKEYENMHAKPLAPEVNFAIKLDDAPLNDMTDLIEKYKRDREQDMHILPEPPLSNAGPTQAQSMAPPLPTPSLMPSLTHMDPPINRLRKGAPRLSVIKEEDVQDEIEAESVLPSQSDTLQLQINDLRNELKELQSLVFELKSKLDVSIDSTVSESATDPV